MPISLSIKKIHEYEISEDTHSEITRLWNVCFDEEELDRSYFKQLPHIRFLAYENNQLIGHLGVDYRVFSVNGKPIPVFGVIDLCVLPNYQKQGVASALLTSLESLADIHLINHILLIARDNRLYSKHGYSYINEYCSWLRIDEHKNYGVAFEKIDNEVMIKSLHGQVWPVGPIDFLGYMY